MNSNKILIISQNSKGYKDSIVYASEVLTYRATWPYITLTISWRGTGLPVRTIANNERQQQRHQRPRLTRASVRYAGCIGDNSTILPRAIVDPKDIFERRCRGVSKWTVAGRLLPILRRTCRRKFPTFHRGNERSNPINSARRRNPCSDGL